MTTKKTTATDASTPAETPKARSNGSRRLKLPPYKVFRLKRVKHPVTLPNAWHISRQMLRTLRDNRRLFVGIFIVYVIVSILLVHGLSATGSNTSVRQQLLKGFSGSGAQLSAGFSSFATMFADATSTSTQAAGVYQVLLTILMSLVMIWTLRHVTAGERVRVKDAFYKSMTPLVPFFLVLLVIILQLLPLLIGSAIYNIVGTYGIAVTGPEKFLWGFLFVVLACVSFYMICSSLFALYIVTLPDMTPMQALRSARKLVRYRRLSVFRKLLFLPVAAGIIILVAMLPIVLLLPVIAPWAFFVIGAIGLMVAHAYLYTLYRELLV